MNIIKVEFTDISIHAPLRGATNRLYSDISLMPISIHAPLRGATMCFSRTVTLRSISIHAPLRGATKISILLPQNYSISIHAPLRGATRMSIHKKDRYARFQSTHPCGVRPLAIADLFVGANFNPRTPAGCDTSAGVLGFPAAISIHAPLRGATTKRVRNTVII